MTGSIPQDRYKSVWLIFFILGLGTLLPWNFFMTASEYFIDRLKDSHRSTSSLDSHDNVNVTGKEYFINRLKDFHSNTSSLDSHDNVNVTGKEDYYNHANLTGTGKKEPPSYLQSIFNNVMTLCAMLPLLIFTCLNSLIHQRIPQRIRIGFSLVAIFLVFMVTAIVVKVPMEPLTFFIVTMVKIVLINSFGAILQGSLFGLAGLLPASYTAPIMSGQGLAGTFAAVAMICAIATGSELKESAFGYFITACAVIIIAIGSYIMLPRLDFFCFYSMKNKREYATSATQAEMETKVVFIKKDVVNGVERNHSGNGESLASSHRSSVLDIFKKIWVMAASVCLVFTVTIGVFPAVTVEVKPTIGKDTPWVLYFSPVACFLMFNIFDWAGRSLTAVCVWPGKESRLLPFLVIIRLIFIPLFMLCNVEPRHNLPVIFAHDAWFLAFMLLFSISNGYLASLCMCFGPKKVLSHEAETAGAIMAFFLSLGLALGAILSFPLRAAI